MKKIQNRLENLIFKTADQPPQANAGLIGEAGPGPSYLYERSGGLENNFITRNTTFMTCNLMHMAYLLKKWISGTREYQDPMGQK